MSGETLSDEFEHFMRACAPSRLAWYRRVRNWLEYDRELMKALQELVEMYNRWGLRNHCGLLRLDGRQ